MPKLIASIGCDKNIILDKCKSFYRTKVIQLSVEHEIPIYYEIKLKEVDSTIELWLLNRRLQEWYFDMTLRKIIVDELIGHLSIFAIVN